MEQSPRVTTTGYFSLIYALGRAVFAGAWAALTGWARGPESPKLYGHHIMYSASRTLLELMPVHVGQALQGTTRHQYQLFAKKYNIEPSTVEIEDGLFGCWLGEPSAPETLLWFHGGGYVNPAAEQHFCIFLDLIKLAREKGKKLRVLVLEYDAPYSPFTDLAPSALYPTQLQQAVAALKYLVGTGLQPSQIILGGDSAGGNLVGAVLLHLSRPHPDVQTLSLSGKLAGAILVSPWITFQTGSGSFKRNSKRDMVTPAALTTWSNAFMGTSKRDNYNHPIDAPAAWWKGAKVDKIALVAGSNEVFVDDIRTLVETIKVYNPSVEYLEAVDEGHDAYLVDRAYGLKNELTSGMFIHEWILARLS